MAVQPAVESAAGAAAIRPLGLHGGWLRLAHVVWWAVLLGGLALSLVGMIPLWQALMTVTPHPDPNLASELWQLTPAQAAGLAHLGVTLPFYGLYRLLANSVIMLLTVAMGLLIFLRRSADGLALLVSVGLVTLGLTVNWAAMVALDSWFPPLAAAGFFLVSAAFPILALVLFLFPDGRPVPRWALGPAALGSAIVLGWEAATGQWGGPFDGLLMVVLLLAGTAAQIYRYLRVSAASERQQTKWAVAGLVGALVLGLGAPLLTEWFPALAASDTFVGLFLAPIGTYLAAVAITLALGAAILRSHLWDIDVLIRRSLVYGLVTVLLTAIYFGGVAALQAVLQPLVGAGSDLAVVASTLVVAALFLPLRRGVQRAVDRRFYRSQYDVERTLATFAAALRHEVDLDTLAAHLVGVVETTMQPAGISLWVAGRAPEDEEP